jgi:hypothetical protein
MEGVVTNELYALRNEPEIVKAVKGGRLRWLGQLCRMQQDARFL